MKSTLVLRFTMGMKGRSQAHVTYKLSYHIVWIPKYRRKLLLQGVDTYFTKTLKTYLADQYPDVILEEINVQLDHVHLMIVIPPKYSISKVVGDMKSNTSRELRKKFEYIRRNKVLWSIGYFVSSVGLDEARIRRYISHQEAQDKGRAQLVLL